MIQTPEVSAENTDQFNYIGNKDTYLAKIPKEKSKDGVEKYL